MKRKFVLAPALLVMAISMMAFGCPKAYDAAAKASDDVSGATAAAITVVGDLYTNSKLIDVSEKNTIAHALGDVVDLNVQFRNNVKTIHARGTATKADYLAAAKDLSVSAMTLLNAGTLHVKDPKAQATINTAINAIQLALDGLTAAITQAPGK